MPLRLRSRLSSSRVVHYQRFSKIWSVLLPRLPDKVMDSDHVFLLQCCWCPFHFRNHLILPLPDRDSPLRNWAKVSKQPWHMESSVIFSKPRESRNRDIVSPTCRPRASLLILSALWQTNAYALADGLSPWLPSKTHQQTLLQYPISSLPRNQQIVITTECAVSGIWQYICHQVEAFLRHWVKV